MDQIGFLFFDDFTQALYIARSEGKTHEFQIEEKRHFGKFSNRKAVHRIRTGLIRGLIFSPIKRDHH